MTQCAPGSLLESMQWMLVVSQDNIELIITLFVCQTSWGCLLESEPSQGNQIILSQNLMLKVLDAISGSGSGSDCQTSDKGEDQVSHPGNFL